MYYIGNSLTDNIRYAELANSAAKAGHEIIWGRHMIPGAPLSWLYNHQKGGITTEPFGPSRQALAEHNWDLVSFQPFDRHLTGETGDATTIGRYLADAAPTNADTRYAIYWHWPRMRKDGRALPYDSLDFDPSEPGDDVGPLGAIDDFGDLWTQPYTGPSNKTGGFESRDYYQKLTAQLRDDHPDRTFVNAPVGEVMYQLHQQMQDGEIPGYRTAWQLYKDTIHLNEAGCYVAGATYFTLITGDSPTNFSPTPYGDLDPALVQAVQKTVIQVLLSDSDAPPSQSH